MAYPVKEVIDNRYVPQWGNTKQFIYVHYLGVTGENYRVASDGCGAHYTIYHDGTIYHAVDDDAVVWAVGTAGYYTQKHPKANNFNGISIEMCCYCDGDKSSAEDKKWWFTTETQEACVQLVKSLMKKYNIPASNVLRHYDVVNKTCPAPYVHNNNYRTSWTWSEFKAKITDKAAVDIPTGIKASGIPSSKEDYISKVLAAAVELYPKTKILPSVVIAQCCLETGYGLGADSTELVKRNNILGMKTDLINSTWKEYSVWNGEKFTKRTPEYYNGVLTYINDSFRVYSDYKNCIEDYEMFLLHVQNDKGYKYNSIAGMTDPAKIIHIIRVSQNGTSGYCTDPNYETKVLKIISENDLTKYDIQTEKSDMYYVRLKPKADVDDMETQIGAYKSLDEAKKKAKQYCVGYKIYDSKMNVVYDTGALTKQSQIDIACNWAIETCRDDRHGYNNEYEHRSGNPDYACSSFVNQAWREANVTGLKSSKDTYTANMKETYLACGFEDVTSKVNLRTGEGVKKGDVLLAPGHVEMCINELGALAGARGDAPTNKPQNGAVGDQGGEIELLPYWDDNWYLCLRYKTEVAKRYRRYWVQVGSFSKKANAYDRKNELAKKGIKTKVIKKNGVYILRAGKYELEKNAKKKVEKLKNMKIDAFVKYVK